MNGEIIMSSIFTSTRNTRVLPIGENRYIRSDFPGNLTDDEVEWLVSENVMTIVDQREEKEYTRKTSRLESDPRFRYCHLPVTGGADIPDSPEEVPPMYLRMLDEQMERIIGTILSAGTNVMCFCVASKDRTGVVSAILLKRFGYSDDYIIDDYMKTKDNLMGVMTTYVQRHPEIDIRTVTPCEENIKAVLEALSGSVSYF